MRQSQSTLEASLDFNHPAFILCSTKLEVLVPLKKFSSLGINILNASKYFILIQEENTCPNRSNYSLFYSRGEYMSLDYYKAHLVVLGNKHAYWIDYVETFSPVAKMALFVLY